MEIEFNKFQRFFGYLGAIVFMLIFSPIIFTGEGGKPLGIGPGLIVIFGTMLFFGIFSYFGKYIDNKLFKKPKITIESTGNILIRKSTSIGYLLFGILILFIGFIMMVTGMILIVEEEFIIYINYGILILGGILILESIPVVFGSKTYYLCTKCNNRLKTPESNCPKCGELYPDENIANMLMYEMVWDQRRALPAIQKFQNLGGCAKVAIPKLLKYSRAQTFNYILIEIDKLFLNIGKDAVPELINNLKNPDNKILNNAIYYLGVLGEIANESLPNLKSLLEHPNKRIKKTVQEAINKIEIL